MENNLREKYQYKLDYIEFTHRENLKGIKPNTQLNGRDIQEDIDTRINNENKRYQKDLKNFEFFISELEKYKDFPEVIWESNQFKFNNELQTMQDKGYEVIAVINITDDFKKLPIKKLYKLRKKENE